MLSRLFTFLKRRLGRIVKPSVLASVVVAAAAVLAHLLTTYTGTTTPSLEAAQVGKRFPAPDLVGGTDWLNVQKPLKLADLKGRIVLLDFWTLCCINCIHVMPDLAKLEQQYPGILVVIGVHSPKFENEKKTASIMKAIQRYEIKHPVINDADHKLWRAYNVNSWPTFVLIDPDGKYYGTTGGEGKLDVLELHIKKLIKEFDGKLKKDPLEFKLVNEKTTSPLFFPGKVLADDASKRLFIADSTNHRIVITNLEGKKIAVAGSGKEGLKDGAFAEAEFSDPQGMCLDGETLYVADRKNHAIRALDLKKETVKMVCGNGEQNRFGRQGVFGKALKIGLNSPWDLLLHQKKIYIAMAGHHQIWIYEPGKEITGAYAGSGAEEIIDGALRQNAPGQVVSAFAQPSGLATDGKTLFVADSETSSVRALPFWGGKGNVHTVVGQGLFEFGDKNGRGREVRLQHALGIAHQGGKLYVADTYNSKIKLIDPVQQTCETYLGDPPGWLKEKMFNEPGGVCISAGKMYIADTNNHRIQIVDMKSKQISTLRLEGVDPVRRDAAVSSKDKK